MIKDDLVAAIRKLKAEPGPNVTVMGSGTVVAQLAAAGLIDEYSFVLQPVVLGKGRTLSRRADPAGAREHPATAPWQQLGLVAYEQCAEV